MNNEKEIQIIERRSVSTILSDIFRNENIQISKEDLNKEVEVKKLFFRGESRFYQTRTPSLYRENALVQNGSEYYYRTLINELGRDDYEKSTSLVRLFSELQHYGAKTRMLDITKSPLIALYFAVESDDNNPGYLFIYQISPETEKFDTGHTIAIKCALNLMHPQVINNFFEVCEKIKNIRPDLKDESLDNILKQFKGNTEIENGITQFMELLNQRARVRETLKYPIKIYDDLNKGHIFLPAKATDRIRQQQGAFIYPKYVNTKNKNYKKILEEIDESIDEFRAVLETEIYNKKSKNKRRVQFSCIKIHAGYKKIIRNQLRQLGITPAFIYSDIQHQSYTLLNK